MAIPETDALAQLQRLTALVESHEKRVKEIEDFLSRVTPRNEPTAQPTAQSAPNATPQPVQQTVTTALVTEAQFSSVNARPVVPTPTKFSGRNPDELPSFKEQIRNTFLLAPNAYPTDAAKVAFVANLLQGDASNWHASLADDDPRRYDYTAYMESFTKMWGNPLSRDQAAQRVNGMKQGNRSVAAYATDFRVTIKHLKGWGEEALLDHFFLGLDSEVRVRLQSHNNGYFETLDDMIAAAIRIDHQLNRARLDGRRPQGHAFRSNPPLARPMVQPQYHDDPMMVDAMQARDRNTAHRPTQPQRRYGDAPRQQTNDTCFNCGQMGHHRRNCPKTAQGNGMRQGN